MLKRLFRKQLCPEYNTHRDGSPTTTLASNQAEIVEILARTLWGEARGEGVIGMEAVAWVVLNRRTVARQEARRQIQRFGHLRKRYWWGDTILKICRKPYQFSCWNMDDPNMAKMLRVTKRIKAIRRHGALLNVLCTRVNVA